jgi:hypothetical protein
LLSNSRVLKFLFYLDSETSVIIKEKTIANIAGTQRIYESIFKDSRYVNEILLPYSVDVFKDGELVMEINYTSVELDAEIVDFKFSTSHSLKENANFY